MKIYRLSETKTDLLTLNMESYKYCILLRDHYHSNGKGEYFLCKNYPRIKEQQTFWFSNEDRPVHTVILTNDDVPAIIEKRKELINHIQGMRNAANEIRPPVRIDGRRTRNASPELFAEYDRKLAAYKSEMQTAQQLIQILINKLNSLPPYISSTLYFID